MKLSIVSFWTILRIVAKFQIHWLQTFGESREEKNKP
jgi:hypothetical protein